jgi:hypothetical protein
MKVSTGMPDATFEQTWNFTLSDANGGGRSGVRPLLSTSLEMGWWALWPFEPSSHARSAKIGLARSTGPFLPE